MADVIMPQMGESIAEGTVTKWLKNVGDRVERDEPLFEISTDKVDAEIPSPAAGFLKEIRVGPGTTVPIHTVVGVIGAEAEAAATAPPAAPEPPSLPAPASALHVGHGHAATGPAVRARCASRAARSSAHCVAAAARSASRTSLAGRAGPAATRRVPHRGRAAAAGRRFRYREERPVARRP